jgi:DNA/RNA endonuclease YhcR with UshA esterase domain
MELRMKKIILASLLFATPAFAVTYTPTEAARHVGETATVSGVVSVYAPQSGVIFIDMGGAGRTAPFSGFVNKENVAKFPGASAWSGKTLEITGKIETYQGKAEIVLTDPAQVVVK